MENKFVILIPSFNNERWAEQNIKSIVSQTYQNYRVIYINDCSTDRTLEIVQNLVKKYGKEDKFEIINNSERKLALRNIYESFERCRDDEIVIICDGDDEILHGGVLSQLNQIFSDPDTWFIWSQYVDSKGRIGCSAGVGPEVYQNNSFREQSWRFSHLHVFRAWITKYLKEEDMKDQNSKFWEITYDNFLYFPLLELCNTHAKHFPIPMYRYNIYNSLSDHVADNGFKQNKFAEIARKMLRYERIKK